MKSMLAMIVLGGLAVSAGVAADQKAQLPNYSKTLPELMLIKETGGPGGSGSSKVEVVTILGNPSAPGPYAQLLKVKPDAKIAPHHHAGDRIATVLSGTWYFGFGKNRKPSDLRTLSQGSVYTEPSNAPHYAETRSEPVVILITGEGPTDTVYEVAADDPRSSSE
jgi:quercetin dioxygenase-like cupin family protein